MKIITKNGLMNDIITNFDNLLTKYNMQFIATAYGIVLKWNDKYYRQVDLDTNEYIDTFPNGLDLPWVECDNNGELI